MPQFLTSYFYFFVHYKNTFSAQATCTAPYDVHKVSCPVKLKFQSGTVQKIHYTIDLFSDWRSHAGKKKKNNNKTTKHTKKDKSAGDCYGGWGNESVKETDIVLIWAGWSAHPRGYSPDIYREQKWPRDPLWPLWSRWINDTFAPPRRPLFCYWLWKQEALGATHILTAAHSLNCVDVHMCVCVCVCVSRPFSVPLTTLHCNHHTQLPPASLSLSL